MKRASRFLISFVAFSLGVLSVAFAQDDNPTVKWKLLTPTVTSAPGATVVVKVEATIDNNYHLYSLKQYPADVDGPSPTEITVSGGAKLASRVTTSKKPTKHHDPNFEIE